MSAGRPPSVATSLLKRLGPSERNESLVGDLLEEFQSRGSRTWYWKQVLAAIAVDAGRDIRVHKGLAVRAMVTGFGTLILFSWLLTRFALNVLAQEVPPSWWTYHPTYPRGVEVLAALLMCVATFSSGWIVARLHRAHLAGMVLAYFVSFLSYGLVLVATVPQRIPYHSYAYNLLVWVGVISLSSTCILLGIWTVPREGDSQSTPGRVGA
jgi:hypothetical protein